MKINNFKNIFGGAALGLALLAGGATATHAQETQTQPEAGQKTEKQWKKHRRGGEGFRRGGKHHRGGHGGMRAFSRLNLTDAQREQITQIHERFRESRKSLREQRRANGATLDTAQREQMRAQRKTARKQMRAELLNVLTAEQKTQLEQFKAERKQMRQQRKQQFEQRRKQSETQPAPSVK